MGLKKVKRSTAHVKYSVPNRIIYVDGGIDSATVIKVSLALLEMQDAGFTPLSMVIGHSNGGCGLSGIMLFHMLRTSIAPINTYVISLAESAAFIMFLSGKRRVMLQDACVHPHRIELEIKGRLRMSEEGSKFIWDFTRDGNQHLYKIIHEHTGIPNEKINRLFKEDEILNAARARRTGFATNIMSVTSFNKNFPVFCVSNNKSK